MDYRSLEGLSRSLADQGFIPNYQDYSATWERIHNFVPEIRLPSYKELNTATDVTGMNPKNGGQYLEYKYGRKGRKKYIVVEITVDVKHKKLLRMEAHVEGERSYGTRP
ncbi:transposase ISC1058, partial [mine drainage metagenome]